ncbi:hypothetical protein HPB50_003842 [Hyalomma asiaticum]|uniref:Uncharacterized protein n=1 Tax=Hyalomma asiaticum TaxID=266040 RepID=A0ACB7RIX2_HYAAI|nr:hypothetical protein HPB50_003842 [Hyalomma asiaticum]
MSKFKTFSTTTSYGDDYLFARAAVCTLIAGVTILLALLLGSVLTAQGPALSKPAVSSRGGITVAVVPGAASNASTQSRHTTLLRRKIEEPTRARRSTKTTKTMTTKTTTKRRGQEGGDIGLAARLLRESVDDSADPCRDLRAHVCTGYDRGELRGRPLEERAAEVVADAVEASFRDAVGPKSVLVAKHSSLRKAAAFYRSCMDTNPDNPVNVEALAVFFEHNDLPLSPESEASPDFLDKTVELYLRYDIRLFFELRVDVFPDRGPRFVRVVADPDFEEWKRKRLAMRTGRSTTGSEEHLGEDDSVEESWKTSLEAHSGGVFMADFELDVGSGAATSFNDMRSRQGVSDAGRSLLVAWEACRRLANVSTPSPRKSSRCVALTSAEYGHVVRAPYYFSALTVTRLEQVKNMLADMARELMASIDYTGSLPRGVREELKIRVRRVRWMLGYAPGLDQWTGLDRFYMGYPSTTGVFAADYLAARQERMRRFLESLHGKDADARFAFVEQPRSEPMYVASQNRVALPAAFMLPPLFDTRSLPEVNYGLLGSLLLRVMTRATIDAVKFKHQGANRIAWSRRSVKQLSCNEPSAGVRKGAPRPPSVSVGGHALLRAFHSAATEDLRHHSMSKAQRKSRSRLFFLSRCLLFCADDHKAGSNPANHRCNVMARRSHEFAEAFGCPNWRNRTRHRCDVW